jgi:hypothetical protein
MPQTNSGLRAALPIASESGVMASELCEEPHQFRLMKPNGNPVDESNVFLDELPECLKDNENPVDQVDADPQAATLPDKFGMLTPRTPVFQPSRVRQCTVTGFVVGFIVGALVWLGAIWTLRVVKDTATTAVVTTTPTSLRHPWPPTCKPFPNKRVVLVTVGDSYFGMFLNWLHYASRFLDESTEALVVSSLDGLTEVKLQEMQKELPFPVHVARHPHELEFAHRHSNRSLAKYGSTQFATFMGKRPDQILEWLGAGCTVFYVDIDTVWVRPVFPAFEDYQHDAYFVDDTGPDRARTICGCFLYMNPTQANKDFLKSWSSLIQPGQPNEPSMNAAARHAQMNYSILPTPQFPSGHCANDWRGKGEIRILHANWLVGLEAKIKFLQSWGVWNPPNQVAG